MESQVDFLTRRIKHFIAYMKEGLIIFEELIRIGHLQSKIWFNDFVYQIDYSSDITCGDYIVGKILFYIIFTTSFSMNLFFIADFITEYIRIRIG